MRVSCSGFRNPKPLVENLKPRGSIYTTIMELDPKSHNGDGLLGPNSIMVVYVDPVGKEPLRPLKEP